jgi:hypothetical protein
MGWFGDSPEEKGQKAAREEAAKAKTTGELNDKNRQDHFVKILEDKYGLSEGGAHSLVTAIEHDIDAGTVKKDVPYNHSEVKTVSSGLSSVSGVVETEIPPEFVQQYYAAYKGHPMPDDAPAKAEAPTAPEETHTKGGQHAHAAAKGAAPVHGTAHATPHAAPAPDTDVVAEQNLLHKAGLDTGGQDGSKADGIRGSQTKADEALAEKALGVHSRSELIAALKDSGNLDKVMEAARAAAGSGITVDADHLFKAPPAHNGQEQSKSSGRGA